MNENDFIANQFWNNFRGKEHLKFVLYGLGQNTRTILENFSSFSFLGLMDGFHEDGQCFGYPILSEAKVAELKPDIIVIVARKNSTRIIAKRIEEFCRKMGIALCDLDGKDLLQAENSVKKEHPYFEKYKEHLWNEIEAHDVVSFDIFDTLLMRKVLYSEDVFALVEKKIGVKDFSKYRQAAERELYSDGKQPLLKDIYKALQKKLNVDDARLEDLYQCEIETERQVLLPRRDIIELMKRAVEAGKTVWLISDMYYPSEMILSFFTGCGISDVPEIFVSCEYGKGKTQGLYQIIREQMGVDSWLHVGDSIEADAEAASAAGLDVYTVKSAVDMADISFWKYILDSRMNLSERTVFGVMLAHIFNSPFALYSSAGCPVIRTASELGSVIFAPVLMGLFYWIAERCTGKYDVLLWGARDGYMFYRMQRVYQKAFPQRKLPRSVYFYTSRMAAMEGYPTCREDIVYMAGIGFAGTGKELLLKRFSLAEEEILPQMDGEDTESYVLRHEAAILRHAEKARKNFSKYWACLRIAPEQKAAFFDLVSSGSCHMCLEKFLGRKADGFYLTHIIEDYPPKRELCCESYLESEYLMGLKTNISANYEPLETMVMSHEPSLKGYSDEGHAVFADEKRTEADLEYLGKLQAGALRFFEEFCALWGEGTAEISPEFTDKVYTLLRKNNTRILSTHLAECSISDDFTGRDFVMKDMFD